MRCSGSGLQRSRRLAGSKLCACLGDPNGSAASPHPAGGGDPCRRRHGQPCWRARCRDAAVSTHTKAPEAAESCRLGGRSYWGVIGEGSKAVRGGLGECPLRSRLILSRPSPKILSQRARGPVSLSESDQDLGSVSEPNGQSTSAADDSPSSDRRRRLVRAALDAWKKQLVDLGGRNNLLYYRHLKVGTLDLTACEPVSVQTLLEGRSVTLSKLFPDPERLEDARRRARAIHKKALEHYEERGIETLFLAYAMATWTAGIGRGTPGAPVLLRPAILNPRGAAQEDFDLVLTSEMQISPTLLHYLEAEFGLIPDQSQLELDGVIDTPWELGTR